MNSSIAIRLGVTLVVIAMWIKSLFPFQDQPYFEAVQKFSDKRAAVTVSNEDYAKKEAELAKVFTAYQADLYDKGLKANYNSLKAELFGMVSEADVKAFEKTLEDAKKLSTEVDESGLPMTEVEALSRAAGKNGVSLNKFVDVYNGPSLKNKDIAEYVHRETQGKFKQGIDIAGGVEFVVGFSDEDIQPNEKGEKLSNDKVIAKIIQVLNGRINGRGLAETEIRPFGENGVLIRVPKVNPSAAQALRNLLTRPATLTFHGVAPNANGPIRPEQLSQFQEIPSANPSEPPFVIAREVLMTGENIEEAFVTRDENGGLAISYRMNIAGGQKNAEVTRGLIGQRMAIVLDGKCYSAPTVQGVIGSSGQITGAFSQSEAEDLAIVLSSGALPVTLKVTSESITSPKIGQEAASKGVYAAFAGLVVVFIIMLAFYRMAGIYAAIALALNILLVVGTMAIWGAAFTLPGIAGIILTIGMAVDANVLIFERMREEFNKGTSKAGVVKEGFGKAFITIFDANVTTLITAFILASFGTGAIKGFAYTLSIGIIASMFSALFVSRIFFDWALNSKGENMTFNFMPFFFLPKKTIDFMAGKKTALALSVVMLVVAVGSIFGVGSAGVSVEFTGGTGLVYDIEGDIPEISEVEKALSEAGFNAPGVVEKANVTDPDKMQLEVVIRESNEDFEALAKELDSTKLFEKVDKALEPTATLTRVSQNSVDPLVGDEFRSMAGWSIGLSLVAIFFYIMFRFETIFAVGALAALAHDSIISLGLFMLIGSFLGIHVSVPVIAALLTIIGYSLNDTIVVFDRIRENSEKVKKTSITDIVNKSINETLGRTVMTSITTFVVVLILCFGGGASILEFALILLIGVVVGTYSSMFIASPIVCNKNLEGQLKRIQEEKKALEIKRKNDQTIIVE